jgi:hypothetical protein
VTAQLWQATVRGVGGVVVTGPDEDGDYRRVDVASGYWHKAKDVVEPVPLVTLTEDDARALLTATVRNRNAAHALDRLSAQLKPPRMSEPTEFGAMVEASLSGRIRLHFVRAPYHGTPGHDWVAEDSRSRCKWNALVDPRPIGGAS